MYFPPKEVFDDVKAFMALPFTPEQKAIKDRYLKNETTSSEFYGEVFAYLASHRATELPTEPMKAK